MVSDSPSSMAAMTVTCRMTSAGSTRAMGWAASISDASGTRISNSSQAVASFDCNKRRNSALLTGDENENNSS
jgi:hypothetical protein